MSKIDKNDIKGFDDPKTFIAKKRRMSIPTKCDDCAYCNDRFIDSPGSKTQGSCMYKVLRYPKRLKDISIRVSWCPLGKEE